MKISKYIKSGVRTIIRWSSEEYITSDRPEKATQSPLDDRSGSMNFRIFNAVGGKVVEYRSYSKNLNRDDTKVYIITDKEDLGEELSQIITRESLSR